MCSGCSGDVENPDMTAPSGHYDDGTRKHGPEDWTVYACSCGELFVEHSELDKHIEEEDLGRLKQRVRSALATLCVNTRSLLTERRR